MVQRQRLTIRDVAAAAGVSTQTVSRVLNNRMDVAPETLRRVNEIIRETGYSPNMLARGLTQGRSHILGVVAYGLEYFGPSKIVTAIERQAAEMGYAILLTLVLEPEIDNVESILSALSARQVDGIIWAVPEVSANGIWCPDKSPVADRPILLVGGTAGQVNLPSLAIDNVAIGRLATQHLLAGGARNVGIVTGPMTWWEARQRFEGWQSTLEEEGRVPLDCLITEGDWTVSSGEQGLYRILERCPDIDAVFASNDQMALGVLHAAHRLGISVPDRLSVVGVDNIAEASHFWPPLTTVYQPLADEGARAVEEIDRLINRALGTRRAPTQPLEPRLLQPALIARASSRPPVPDRVPLAN